MAISLAAIDADSAATHRLCAAASCSAICPILCCASWNLWSAHDTSTVLRRAKRSSAATHALVASSQAAVLASSAASTACALASAACSPACALRALANARPTSRSASSTSCRMRWMTAPDHLRSASSSRLVPTTAAAIGSFSSTPVLPLCDSALFTTSSRACSIRSRTRVASSTAATASSGCMETMDAISSDARTCTLAPTAPERSSAPPAATCTARAALSSAVLSLSAAPSRSAVSCARCLACCFDRASRADASRDSAATLASAAASHRRANAAISSVL